MAEFHHGITGRETASGKIPIRNAATAVIAMLAFADDADEETFPLNTPVPVTSINRVLPKAGTTGNLRKNLEIISQITSPTLVVIRIDNPQGDGLDQSLVIGTTEETGQRTGLQVLLTVKSVLGLTPKIICVPDVETIDIANAIGAICKKLRAYSYITPRNASGLILQSAEQVVNFRKMLAFREIELIWPEWTSGNVFLGSENQNGAMSAGISPDLQYSDEESENEIHWAIEVNGTLFPTEIGNGEYSYLEDYLQENKEMLGITGEYKEEESAVYIQNITNTRKFIRLIPNAPYVSNMKFIGNPTAKIDSDGIISFWLEANNEVQIPDDGGSDGGVIEEKLSYLFYRFIQVLNNPNIIYGVIKKYIGLNSEGFLLARLDLKEENNLPILEYRYALPLKASTKIDNNIYAADTPEGVILNTWSDGVNIDFIRDTGLSISYEDIAPISQAAGLHSYIPLSFSNKFICASANTNPSGLHFCTLENSQMSGNFVVANGIYNTSYNGSLTKFLMSDVPAYLHTQSVYTITESGIEKTASMPMQPVYDSITNYWGVIAVSAIGRYTLRLIRSNSISQRVLQIVDLETLEMKFIDVSEYTNTNTKYIYASNDLSKIAFGNSMNFNFTEVEYDYASNSILSSKSNTESFYISNDTKFKIYLTTQENKPHLMISNGISESTYSIEGLLQA